MCLTARFATLVDVARKPSWFQRIRYEIDPGENLGPGGLEPPTLGLKSPKPDPITTYDFGTLGSHAHWIVPTIVSWLLGSFPYTQEGAPIKADKDSNAETEAQRSWATGRIRNMAKPDQLLPRARRHVFRLSRTDVLRPNAPPVLEASA